MEAKKKTAGKKHIKYPEKKGINLIQTEEKKRNLLLTIIGVLLLIVLLEVGIKYGVLDLYAKLNEAELQYDNVHVNYVAAQNQLRDYDDVLLEYRTYSMDWMEKDTSGKYVSVDRRDVLDLIESRMMRYGSVKSVSVSGTEVNIEMTGLNLQQISRMCAELETSPIVESAVLLSAGTVKDTKKPAEETEEDEEADETARPGDDEGSVLTFRIQIHLQAADENADKEG